MNELLEYTLIGFAILTLIAILCYWYNFTEDIIISKIHSQPGDIPGDQFYYLPQAHISLTVTAHISVVKSVGDQSIIDATVNALSFVPAIDIKPDPAALISIEYEGNWFSNDELQIITTPAGLLENMKVSSEDRLSNIVAMFTQLPGTEAADFRDDAKSFSPTDLLTETVVVEVVQVFQVLPSEMAEGEIDRTWQIPLTGISPNTSYTVDASFKLTSPIKLERKAITAVSTFKGLFLRPPVAQDWILEQHTAQPVSFSCIVPDTRSLLTLPIRRAPFVKSQQLPKFQNGMLIENTITKPSEAEGLASIPIHILKAIASIPATLFQFRTGRVQDAAKYQQALAELEKAKAGHAAEAAKTSLQQLKTELEQEKARRLLLAGNAPQPGKPQLGKLPPKEPEEDIAEDFLESRSVLQLKALNPNTPEGHDWSTGYDSWNVYQNNTLKTCVPAAAAHLRVSWTLHAHPPVNAATTATVLDTLKQVAPGHDIFKGCYMSDFMSHWRDVGMDGAIIERYIKFRKKNPDLLKEATYWFGGCLIGLQLPQSAIGKTEWNYPSSEPGKDNINWGGHTVCVLGYTKNSFTVISWGQRITMSVTFYQQYNDESYVALSRTDWTTEKDQSPTRGNLAFNELDNFLNDIDAA